MNSKEMTQDQFATFMANIILTDIQNYQYDAFYDIAKVVDLHKEKRAITESEQYSELHLFTRSTGCDLVSPDSDLYGIYKSNNSNCYKFKFVWNCDYLRKVPFCTLLD